jgi:hypothetical protein
MYTTATVARLDVNSDGKVTIIIQYTGDSGEPMIESAYPVDASDPPTQYYMRGEAMQKIARLNNNLTFRTNALPFVGTVLDTTTPLPTNPVATFGSYCAVSSPFTPGITPTDVFAIVGSATKTIDVVRMAITTVQTTAGMNAWSIVKRSTASTGGTSAVVTAVPVNDSMPAASAVVRQATANPTLGTLIGSVWSGRVPSPVASSAVLGLIEQGVDFASRGMAPVTLTGTTDALAWNFGGAALPAGLTVVASVWWNER